VLWCILDNNIPIGADSLGERGKTAEKVGKEAALKLVKELNAKTLLDVHVADIIIPNIALVKDFKSKRHPTINAIKFFGLNPPYYL